MKKYLVRTEYRPVGSDEITNVYYHAPNGSMIEQGVNSTHDEDIEHYAKHWGYGNKGAASRALKSHKEMNDFERGFGHWNPTSTIIEFEY